MEPYGDCVSFRKLQWIGQEDPCINQINIESCGQMVLGRYGGNQQAGAHKNEDGAMVVKGKDWEFAMILDGHNSAASVDLVMKTIEKEWDKLAASLKEPVEAAFQSFEKHILSIFQSQSFLDSCKQIQGETACLLSVRKENYLWWLSIGDCLIYLFHDELHKLGQYALNQRQFYEWIGQVNTFAQSVPCYSSGIRELRAGRNRIVLVTDGVLECGGRYNETPSNLYTECSGQPVHSSVERILQHVHENNGRDSATIVCWDYHNPLPATYLSNQPMR
ncbi:protein phosphatase 2C domain-containing protein [Neobacillus soli]|uniref:protein phosphatase 2C domain-containing protein n=1 Tax=Neobacillus soli TaxID=220688 RepID=UPI00082619C1|nr:protein phosphatase 2C domain-containing protein [Neobacillus soli]